MIQLQHISFKNWKSAVKKHCITAIMLLMVLTISACSFSKESLNNSLSEQDTDKTLTHDDSNEEDNSENTTDNLIDKFELNEDLEGAICQLACAYDSFDSNTPVNDATWKNTFVTSFIQNSRYSFAYLDNLRENESGIISSDNLEYIQESLTGKFISFDDSVDTNDSSSLLLYGEITNYSYELNGNKVRLTADFSIHYDGTENVYEYDLTAVLVPNSNSCFDGYSIDELSKTEKSTATSEDTGDSVEKNFHGELLEWINDTMCVVEFSNSETGGNYNHFIYLDLSGDSEMCYQVKNIELGTTLSISYSSSFVQDGEMYVFPLEISGSN